MSNLPESSEAGHGAGHSTPSRGPGLMPAYIVATNRPWNRELPARLTARMAGKFSLISHPEELALPRLKEQAPRYIFFPHWSHIIPEEIHAAFECIIFHMTDLPYGRGGSPLQNLIAAGHDRTKITALRCARELDTGPVYLKRDLSLLGSAEEIFLRADRIIEDMIVEIAAQQQPPQPQEGTPTLFKRRTPAMSDLKAAKTLDEAYDLIRMLDAEGYPHAFVQVGPLRLEFSRAARKTGAVVADVRITLAEDE